MIPEVVRDVTQFRKKRVKRYDPVRKHPCIACGQRFKIGDFYTTVPLGPGNDPEARRRAREGRWYAAIGIYVHWACVTGKEVA